MLLPIPQVFSALVLAVNLFLLFVLTMATSPNDETDPMSNRYIPRAARAVPHEEVVHTIEFRKITYPLTDRPAELWIVETFRHYPTGGSPGLCNGQLCTPRDPRPPMACILQCARPFSPGRSTSSSRTPTKFSSCSTSTN